MERSFIAVRRRPYTGYVGIGAQAKANESICKSAPKEDRNTIQTKMGVMPGKLRYRWTGPVWIVNSRNGTLKLGT